MDASILSVNLGTAAPNPHKDGDYGTGIDKRPTTDRVEVRSPGPKGEGLGSGLVGDFIGDSRHHGGDDQAIYSFQREDLDRWEQRLDRILTNGFFGENLTTVGLDVNATRIGTVWRIGDTVEVQVTSARLPCNTFRGWMGEKGWLKKFTADARPGAYLRILTPGFIAAGDAVQVVSIPESGPTVAEDYLIGLGLEYPGTLDPRLHSWGCRTKVTLMNRIQRTLVVVVTASFALGALAGCNPGDISGGSTTPPAPTDIAIPTPTPTPDPQPVFVAPADCHAMAGAALETEFAGKGIVLFNSTNGEGEFVGQPPVSKQGGGNPFSCVWGVPYVDLNSFGLEAQSLTQDAHEGVVAVLGGGGYDVSVDEDTVTYSKVGTEHGQPEDQAIIHVLHPDGWITAWSSFGGQIAYDRLVSYLAAVTAQVYPAP